MDESIADRIIQSRRDLLLDAQASVQAKSPDAAEGGCGVLGFAANLSIAGRHVLTASRQMHNRGNGKGGGIAMVGLDPAQAAVEAETLCSHTLLQVALLDPEARPEVEAQFILPYFELAYAYEIPRLDDFRAVPGLEVRPPDVWRYFGRVKPAVLNRFAEEKGLEALPRRALEDEFVFQNSYRLNQAFYASLGEKRAFVLSHGRNLSVLKIVGYAEQVVEYYRLEEQTAHVWIAHQRYPTKGRVWHPGGAHPFIGLNEALVHNGDFANYHAVSEYLRQRNIGQLFLTDTEVSVQLFDLWERVYGYPLEITLEAMAPTTEHDFLMLPPEKQVLYRAVQRTHMHGSPDGPWFFILARSLPDEARYELLGITDTSMLRPQVFALYENNLGEGQNDGQRVQIGLIASERQAINACLRSLAAEDERFQPVADQYWAARGGSHTDGGAFRFSVEARSGEPSKLTCANKFGQPVTVHAGQRQIIRSLVNPQNAGETFCRQWEQQALHAYDDGGVHPFWEWLKPEMASAGWDEIAWGLDWLVDFGREGDGEWRFSLDNLNRLHDWRYDTGDKKRASLLAMADSAQVRMFEQSSDTNMDGEAHTLTSVQRLTWEGRHTLRSPAAGQRTLALDVSGFPPEGEESAARWMVNACKLGWRELIAYNWRGGRFAACGLGPDSSGVRIDLYGDVGDYAGSGLDGAEVYLHGAGQDQLGQILKRGKLVIHGDVGQTFLYGAKGGEVYVMGSAAGRPLINAVGRPRAVINGTCLDYMAESFMAGDPLNGGGFVILNGVTLDHTGHLRDLETPYPGGNLFSLASGGAIFLRDPHRRVEEDQLNGGVFGELSVEDWALIEPYLQENERLFGIQVEDLLAVGGERLPPKAVYRKVVVGSGDVLHDVAGLNETENR
jgi:glutamate synthase domain-containing protein 1